MNIASIFIRRPVMTTLVMIAIVFFGVMAYRQLPVNDLPNVDFPTIQVSASLPGANPETMAAAVATPLERQFSTIAGLDSMTSASSLGSTNVTLQFNLSRELDAAAQDVQAAIAAAARQLPPNMPAPPSDNKVNPADGPVHLDEIGRVIDDVENNQSAAWFRDKRAFVLAVQKQPGTNAVEVSDRVRALLPVFRRELPAGVDLQVHRDRAQSIRDSVNDVKFTLMLTLFLVILVIFLFLRNVSATVIPSLALPMSIVGTFAVMWLCGYSLDNLSLMALTLSVGFVVDDAIVMLENIVRHMEMGEGILEAAFNGSKEIAFTIVSMTISLAAVFIPVLFM